MTRSFVLACAALGLLAGCEVDDSVPSRPRQANFLTPNDKAQQNAEQRSLEKPARDLPTTPSDLPGQSAAPALQPVLTLDAAASSPAAPAVAVPAPTTEQASAAAPTFNVLGFSGPKGWDAIGHTTEPPITYTRDLYPGVIPHVPLNPGTTPIPGATPMPGGDFAVEHAWGQALTLTQYPHRDWPVTTAHYEVVHATYNPLYYTDVQPQLPVRQNDGSYCSDFKTVAMNVPWFYTETMFLPVLMVLQPPLAKYPSGVANPDPNYNGYLPGGPTVPLATPGMLKWDYPFLNPDGTVKQTNQTTGTTPMP